ncbi:M24 family metallopeptidase [Christiangramia sabulilitoris]|uniref:Aminopeptidase P family protein n=1 Tax=Christiangramia sabulilitoris TaxID=2583991 RepID=A0A550I2Y2_9FLAO|nr:M24 family metallopeptidase [Christiangramia sabulilitoris]TRO65344.1 aminopeptidase P family protein [Christiangramia sabulilitoris]
MKKILLATIILFTAFAQSQVLDERERSKVNDQILADRFNNLLPKLMDRSGIDMWVVISREYNEDPVLRTMLPSTWLNARRRTILVFNRDKEADSLEKLAIARYNIGDNIVSAWDKEKEPNQWKALIDIIKERNPSKIALNFSDNFGIADGLAKTDFEQFKAALPGEYHDRIVSAEDLAVGWIETRTLREMVLFSDLVELTHEIIAEAFSTLVIQPGVTTTDDVVWWLRQKVTDMGMETWFHPTVDIQRSNEELVDHITAFSNENGSSVILPGDLIHCDFGISYLNLNTDCQQMAYVLKDGENKAPVFLEKAFSKGNLLQDILTSNFKTGLTGNEILKKSLKEAKEQGLKASIYTHPLGLYGHSAGPTIGMWDQQGGVPGPGDYPLYENTAYAIELNTEVNIPEWEKSVRIMLEEAGFWGEDGFRYVNKRQRDLRLIPSEKAEN